MYLFLFPCRTMLATFHNSNGIQFSHLCFDVFGFLHTQSDLNATDHSKAMGNFPQKVSLSASDRGLINLCQANLLGYTKCVKFFTRCQRGSVLF